MNTTADRRSTKNPLARWLNGSWRLLAAPLLLFIALPLVALITRVTLPDMWTNLGQRQVSQAIGLSFLTSLLSTLAALLFGTPVAYTLAQRKTRFSRLIDILVDLPTVLPPAVAGVCLLLAFGRRGLLGPWLAALGLSIPFTMLAVVMAQTFIAAPLYIRAAAIGFAAINPELEQAAALDGANRWQVFFMIVVPLARVALLSGSVLCWARALGEFGATIIFAGNYPGRTQTMPLAIYIGFEIDLSVALTLSLILICLSFLTLIIVKAFLQARSDS
jgi:molybdate transport system permease protein